jgi:uncharacterized repeat protein (TIGR03803 family)
LSGSTLYGTTQGGGTNQDGIVYSIPVTGGPITTLFNFNGTNNGKWLYGDLTLIGSTLYGTAQQGGANNDGVLFSMPITLRW